jgi:uroporphyrinogen-III synthase
VAHPTFDGLRVLSFESRRAAEITSLIRTYGGEPLSAPALRELPLESQTEAIEFARAVGCGEYDVAVFLTGVGLRAMLGVAETVGQRDAFVAGLGRMQVAARGPKPMAVLRELGITPWVLAPEPNTWRELLAAIDAHGADAVRGRRVAVQEYGRPSPQLVDGLSARGATVTTVPLYQYALPDDLAPLRAAIEALLAGGVDVTLFTTATQVTHLFSVAGDTPLREAIRSTVIASIGPTTSEELVEQGVTPDFEPAHPKMGSLVREAAERAAGLLRAKRA